MYQQPLTVNHLLSNSEMAGDGDYKETRESSEVYLELLEWKQLIKKTLYWNSLSVRSDERYTPSLSKDRKRTVYMYNVPFSFCYC